MFVVLLVWTAAMLVQYLPTLANCPVFVRAALTCLGMLTTLHGMRPSCLPTSGLRRVSWAQHY